MDDIIFYVISSIAFLIVVFRFCYVVIVAAKFEKKFKRVYQLRKNRNSLLEVDFNNVLFRPFFKIKSNKIYCLEIYDDLVICMVNIPHILFQFHYYPIIIKKNEIDVFNYGVDQLRFMLKDNQSYTIGSFSTEDMNKIKLVLDKNYSDVKVVNI